MIICEEFYYIHLFDAIKQYKMCEVSLDTTVIIIN